MKLEAEFVRTYKKDDPGKGVRRAVEMLVNGTCVGCDQWGARQIVDLCKEELDRWTAEIEAAAQRPGICAMDGDLKLFGEAEFMATNPKALADLQERIDRQRTHIEGLERALDQRNEEIERLKAAPAQACEVAEELWSVPPSEWNERLFEDILTMRRNRAELLGDK